MPNVEVDRGADAKEFTAVSNGLEDGQPVGFVGACNQPGCGRPPCTCGSPCKPQPPAPCKAPPCKPGRV